MKRILSLIALLVFVLSLAACSAPDEKPPIKGASISGPLNESEAGERWWFTVEAVEEGEPVGIDFRGAVIQGSVRAQLRDAAGQVVWKQEANQGPFAVNTVVNLPKPGVYELGMAWDGAASAQYSLKWQPGEVENLAMSPLALLGGVGMLLVAIAFVVYAVWKKLGWSYLGWGALAWVIAVILKFVWAIPINTPVYNALFDNLPKWLAGPIFWVYVGALTGVFEVALVWLVLRYTKLGKTTWERALAFGIGFGAVEALLLGLSNLANVLTAMLVPATIPYEGLASLAQLNNPFFGLAPIVERAATIFVHILSNVLLFYGVQKKQPRWFWLAFAYKTAIDAVAAFAQLWGVNTLGRMWLIEAIVVVFGIAGWWGIRWLQPRYEHVPPPSGGSPEEQLP